MNELTKNEIRLLKGDHMFISLCQYYELTPDEGWREASRPKTETIQRQYFSTLDDHSEENVLRGWNVDTYRPFRNWLNARKHSICSIVDDLKITPGDKVLDYGCSVSNFGYFLMRNAMDVSLTLADIESGYFNFCKWYYADYAEEFIDIPAKAMPLRKCYNKILLRDVFEHVAHPLLLVKHLHEHLEPNGLFFETFIFIDDFSNRTSNLESAQEERPYVFQFLEQRFELVKGQLGTHPGPRVWRKKSI